MDNPESQKSLREEVLQSIKNGRIKMRPKWQFVLETLLFISGAALLLFATVYLFGFVIFSLRQTGAWFGPGYGSRGWFAFFNAMPWLLIFLSVIFIAALEIFIKHRTLAYRTPLIFSVLAIVLLALIGGGLTADLHRDPFYSARENRLPFAGGMYRRYGMPPLKDVRRGVVVATTTNGFEFSEMRGQTSTILLSKDTRLSPNCRIEPGQALVVFGEEMPDGIRAFGIREAEE